MCDQQSKAKGMVYVINFKSIVQDLGHDCSCDWSVHVLWAYGQPRTGCTVTPGCFWKNFPTRYLPVQPPHWWVSRLLMLSHSTSTALVGFSVICHC